MKYTLPLFALLSSVTCAHLSASALDDSKEKGVWKDVCQKLSETARWFAPRLEEPILTFISEKNATGKLLTQEELTELIINLWSQADGENLTNLNTEIFTENPTKAIPADMLTKGKESFFLEVGYSHGMVSHLEQLALERIYACVSATQDRRVNVLDIGAGHGFFAWKALVAGWQHASAPHTDGTPMRGARVIAFEQHRPLLAPGSSLKSFFTKAKPYLASGVLPKDYTALIPGDAVVSLAEARFQNMADVAHLGNMLHYLCPAKATECVRNLFGATRAGGYAFASAHTGLSLPETTLKEGDSTLFSIYQEHIGEGKKFPGYVMLDVDHISTKSRIVKFHSLNEETDAFSPAHRYSGFYKSTVSRPKDHNARAHYSYALYDGISLKNLFEGNGFIVHDVFFTGPLLQRIEVARIGQGDGRFSSVAETDHAIRVCVVAQKKPV